MDFIRTDIKRYRLRRSDIWGTLWGCDAPAVLSNWKYRDSIKSCGAKNARDRVRGVFMTNCFVHMIEFELTIEFCALLWQDMCQPAPVASTHDWSRRGGLSGGTSDTLRYNWQEGIFRARSQIPMFWSELHWNQNCWTHWGSKTLVETEGIFNFWLVRNSGHGSRIFIWYPVYTGWKYPEWIFRTWFSFLDAHTCPFGA